MILKEEWDWQDLETKKWLEKAMEEKNNILKELYDKCAGQCDETREIFLKKLEKLKYSDEEKLDQYRLAKVKLYDIQNNPQQIVLGKDSKMEFPLFNAYFDIMTSAVTVQQYQKTC